MISLRYILAKVSPFIVSEKLSEGWDTLAYEVGFVGSRGQLRSGRLYIPSAHDLTRAVHAERGAAIIACNATDETPTEGPDDNTFISLSCKTEVVYDIIDEALEFQRSVDSRLAAIDNTDIASKACALAAQVTNGLAFLTDQNGFVIAESQRPEAESADGSADAGGESRFSLAGSRTMRSWIDEMANIDCLIGDAVHLEGTEHALFGHRIGLKGKPKGYVFVETGYVRKDCQAAVSKIARYLDTHFSSKALLMPDTSTVEFSAIWEKVAKREITSAKTIEREFQDAPYPISGFVGIGLIVFDTEGRTKSLSSIITVMKMLLPEVNFAIFANQIVFCMCYEDRVERPVFKEQEKIVQLLEESEAHLFTSTCTRRFEGLFSLYQALRRTSELLNSLGVLNDAERIVYSQDYNTYYLIDLAVRKYLSIPGNDDTTFLLHPAIAILTRYDREHNANLRKTLYYYLINDCNLVKTAESIYMHRNTVLNKVNKIKKLIGTDLDNALLKQKLILSCQIALYMENVLSREII